MSVPKYKRSKSSVDFFYNLYQLNDKLTLLLIKDFGIKRVTRDIKTISYTAKMEQKDRETFIDLCNRYGIDIEAEYPLWLIEYYRERLLDIMARLIDHVTQANSIYATTITEFEFRRKYQWLAIGECYQLLQLFQTVIRNLPVDVEKFMPFVKMISDELEALKAWKKSDNRILKAIKEKQ